MPNFSDDRGLQHNGAFGTHFLTAVTTNTFLVIIHGWFCVISIVPIYRLPFHGATIHARSALSAFLGNDHRLWNQSIIDEMQDRILFY